MKPSDAELTITDDLPNFSRDVANWLLHLARAKQGPFSLFLSGGATPGQLYRLLAQSPYREDFPWGRSHVYWGDERYVAWNSPRSNYHMAYEALLSFVPVPASNIHPIPTDERHPAAAAARYERQLKLTYGASELDPDRPLFDVVLLGLGTDGHMASLFPGSPVLTLRDQWVAAAVDQKSEPRISLTYPALESCAHAAFLVAGSDKRSALARLRHDDSELPAARFNPVGTLRIFADYAASVGEEVETP